jgi:cellulose 1,4-beta-cellobiosidase
MAGMNTVTGFITNTANYSSLKEAYFDINTMVGGTSVKMAKWVDFNNYVDESSFSQGLRQKLVSAGFDSKIGMLIDTSRNGWGGSARPTAASTATDVDMFVNQSRIDRRIHAGNWCNQSGAGLGERPRANPAAGLHAYVWIKPPGESDGSSMMIQNNDGKGFDRMCDPTYTGNERNGNSMTGSLANAPLSGVWFSSQFQELMKNAYPAL